MSEIKNKSTCVQEMTRRQTGDEPLPDQMMTWLIDARMCLS